MNAFRLQLTMFFALGSGLLFAQETAIFIDREKVESWSLENSARHTQRILKFKQRLWRQGYLFAGLDSMTTSDLYFHRGRKYDLAGSASYDKLIQSAQRDFRETVNSGYPFASLDWDSVYLSDGKLSATYEISRGPFVEFDSLILITPIKTKRWFIEQMLGIQKGTPYSERTFETISSKLNRIDFIEEKAKADLSFQDGKATTYLNLRELSSGSFQGVLGVLPNQTSDGKPLITGSLDLSLNNLFRSGKQLDFAWDRFGESSQKLDIRYAHPYLLRSNLNVELDLNILKQDSSFVSAAYGMSASWFVSNSAELGVSYEQSSNNILLSDDDRIVSQRLLDFDQNWYGFYLKAGVRNRGAFQNISNIMTKAEIGQRSITRNANLPTDYYDSIQLNSNLGRLAGSLEFQRTMKNQFAFYSKLSFGHIEGRQLPQNQLFRVGGLRTLRGFNEQFFFVESYLINRAEFRLYFEQRSFLYAFWDQGFLESDGIDYPTGLGLGFSLDTTSGLFSFAMAVGTNRDFPFDIATSKIHFGYLSRF